MVVAVIGLVVALLSLAMNFYLLNKLNDVGPAGAGCATPKERRHQSLDARPDAQA
jgi:hypothetical protein